MATDRVFVCPQCGPFPTTGKLFDVLLARAREEPLRCSKCSGLATLRLKFPFGLNAADSECTVRDCFVPRTLEAWKEKDGSNVTFYPFLVIVHRHGRELAAWLPYWHVVERGTKPLTKYGQWAPIMDSHLFADLLLQAQAKGYFADGHVRPHAM